MATHTTAQSGKWSDAATWDAQGIPVNNGVVVIAAGHEIQMDVDQSAWADGCAQVTVTGGATPGLLYWKDSALTGCTVDTTAETLTKNGHGLADGQTLFVTTSGTLPSPLAINTKYFVVGRTTNTFQLAMSSGGSALDLTTQNGTSTTNVHPIGNLKIKTGTTLLGTNVTNRGRVCANSDGVYATTTALEFASKAIIDLAGTAKIDARLLDFNLRCAAPSLTSVRTYGTKKTVTGSAANDTLTNNSHGWANATPLHLMVTAGTLPAPLQPNTTYYVVGTATNTFQLAAYSGGLVIDLTTDGTGTIEAYAGYAATSNTPTLNVLDDISGASSCWVNATGHNRVAISDDYAPSDADCQINATITTVSSTQIVLQMEGAEVIAAKLPGARIWLSSRNISIRAATTTTAQPIVDYVTTDAGHTGSNYGCEIVNTSSTSANKYTSGVYYGSGHTISGTVSGCTSGVYYGSGHTISGTVSGCSNGVYSGSGHTISGTVSGCTYGVYYGSGHTISGTVSGCTNGVYYAGFTGYGMVLTGNTTPVLHFGITGGQLLKGRCFRYAAGANDTRAWSAGGSMAPSTEGERIYSKPWTHKFTYNDSAFWNVMEWELGGVTDLVIYIPVYAKLEASGLAADERLHWQIIDPMQDPFCGAYSALDEWIAADSTSEQTHVLTYTRTHNMPLLLRCCAKRASGNAFAFFDTVDLPAASSVITTDTVNGAAGTYAGGGGGIFMPSARQIGI